MVRLLLFLFFTITFSFAYSQGSMVFCDRVDGSGNPGNSFESLILSPEGQSIQILYRTKGSPLGIPKVKLEIAVLKNHSFQKTEEHTIASDPVNDFFNVPYTLKSPGDYRFRLFDDRGKLLAEEILSVSVEMSEPGNSRENQDSTETGSDIQNSDLAFSDGVSDDFNSEFSFRITKGKVQLTLQPFDEAEPVRILDIWQNENGQYKLFIRSEEAMFTKEGDRGIYYLTFPAMKDYKVDVHAADNTLITSGFVSFK